MSFAPPPKRDYRYPPRLVGPNPMPYTPSFATDIRVTIERVRRAMAQGVYGEPPLPAVFRRRDNGNSPG